MVFGPPYLRQDWVLKMLSQMNLFWPIHYWSVNILKTKYNAILFFNWNFLKDITNLGNVYTLHLLKWSRPISLIYRHLRVSEQLPSLLHSWIYLNHIKWSFNVKLLISLYPQHKSVLIPCGLTWMKQLPSRLNVLIPPIRQPYARSILPNFAQTSFTPDS